MPKWQEFKVLNSITSQGFTLSEALTIKNNIRLPEKCRQFLFSVSISNKIVQIENHSFNLHDFFIWNT
jgi:hypothetical protein